MSVDAPERIWVYKPERINKLGEIVSELLPVANSSEDYGEIEYVRIDKLEELAAELEGVNAERIAALDTIIERNKSIQAAEAALAEKDKEIAALREWQPIETAPFNRPIDLWCTYQEAPATWGNGLPSGGIVYGRHRTEEYGWFGNQSKDGVPIGDGPDLIPVAWREPSPRIPIEMMEAFLEARNAGGNNGE